MPLVTAKTGYHETGSKLQKFTTHCTESNTMLRALSLKSCITQHMFKQLVCFIRNTVEDMHVSQYRFVCIYSHLSPFMCHALALCFQPFSSPFASLCLIYPPLFLTSNMVALEAAILVIMVKQGCIP